MKDEIVDVLDKMSKELHNFVWENAYKLSKRELVFISGIVSQSYIHLEVIKKLLGNDPARLAGLIDEVCKEKDIEVLVNYNVD